MDELVKKVLSEVLKRMNQFQVEASARHVHLSASDVEELFGKGHTLTFARELSQPGQFLAKERVRLIGPKGIIENVAVLGPARGASQVELSMTDSRQLGIKPVVRESGKVKDTPGVIIASEKAVLTLKEGVIVAKRHIHMKPEDAVRLGVKDQDLVSVRVKSERPVIFEDVLVRVHESYGLTMHIDFDEANACGLSSGVMGEIL